MPARLQAWLSLLVALALLAGCATQGGHRTAAFGGPRGAYPPPGPASDPWGPYIREAAARFAIPERWIREVMRRESGGQAQAVSSAGAMGLMQVIPDTYETLRQQYGLGDDPFEPHDNIMAGAGYIRQMYDRYGSPGFLAAYNAGPNRLDLYLAGSRSLPDETVNYIAAVAPRLGNTPAMSGPLAMYAAGGNAPYAASGNSLYVASGNAPYAASGNAPYAASGNAPYAASGNAPPRAPAAPPAYAAPYLTSVAQNAGCDADAPDAPSPGCPATPAPAAPAPAVPAQVAAAPCDADAAYDPDRPCRPITVAEVAAAAPQPQTQTQTPTPAPPAGHSAIFGLGPPPPPNSPSPPAALAGVSALFGIQSAAAAEPPHRGDAWAPHRDDGLAPHRGDGLAPHRGDGLAPHRGDGLAPHRGDDWAIQVGAFVTPELARSVATIARDAAPDLLRAAAVAVPATAPAGGSVLYRARLTHLALGAAVTACARLAQRQLACMVIAPDQNW